MKTKFGIFKVKTISVPLQDNFQSVCIISTHEKEDEAKEQLKVQIEKNKGQYIIMNVYE